MSRFGSFILFASVLALASCGENSKGESQNIPGPVSVDSNSADSLNVTTIQWIDSVKEVGKIVEGQKLVLSFRFRNSGDKPLLISSVAPSCGCTVAEKPEKPIMPGEEGEIRGEFNSEGRVGVFNKTMLVLANVKGKVPQLLVFKGEVVPAKK